MKREDIYAVEEIERDICLVAGFLIGTKKISLEDSRGFINDDVPEIAIKFVEAYPKFAKDGDLHDDYIQKIDDFSQDYLIKNYGL